MLSLLANDSLQRLNALKVLLSLLTATASVVIFAIFAPVDWFAVLLLAPSTLVGGYLGILVAKRMPDARAALVGRRPRDRGGDLPLRCRG